MDESVQVFPAYLARVYFNLEFFLVCEAQNALVKQLISDFRLSEFDFTLHIKTYTQIRHACHTQDKQPAYFLSS